MIELLLRVTSGSSPGGFLPLDEWKHFITCSHGNAFECAFTIYDDRYDTIISRFNGYTHVSVLPKAWFRAYHAQALVTHSSIGQCSCMRASRYQ